ncbi:MAG: hypothetical protein K2K53_03470, partial [Oscillospiraceae bacterium]|nr:hypothetical protein [Oscillospiraceae bacterium]
LKTKWEVEEYLEKRYGREFAVLSSGSVIEDYYDDHVWRVRLYGEPIWPKDQSCFIRIGSNELSTKIDTSAEAIEEYILSKASWYEEKYIQVQ